MNGWMEGRADYINMGDYMLTSCLLMKIILVIDFHLKEIYNHLNVKI